MSTTLGLAMIVRDEEKTLPNLLSTIEGIFDQIVILDTGSKDQTMSILNNSKLNIQLIKAQWRNDFAHSRNQVFREITTDLICWLDADDVLPDATQMFLKGLRALSLQDHPSGYLLNYQYEVLGKPVLIMDRMSVVRRDAKPVWEFPIYEQLKVEGAVVHTHKTIVHKVETEEIPRKNARNKKILDSMLETDPNSTHALEYLGMLEISQGQGDEALEHFKRLLRVSEDNVAVRVKILQMALEKKDDSLFDDYFDPRLEAFAQYADVSGLLGYQAERQLKSAKAVGFYEYALTSNELLNIFPTLVKKNYWLRLWPIERMIRLYQAKGDETEIRKYKLMLLKYAGVQ